MEEESEEDEEKDEDEEDNEKAKHVEDQDSCDEVPLAGAPPDPGAPGNGPALIPT